jgi:sulfite exporter TauE/SafE
MPDIGLLAMFLVGLLGAGHCAGMCGGIVSALSAQPGGARLSMHFAYSAGRIVSYSVAGAIAGMVGGLGLMLSDVLPMQLALYVVANIMLVLLGLYLAGMSSMLTRLEPMGRALWRRLQPLGRRLFPVDSAAKALAVGAIWGWIPCGLVYAVLAAALFAGSPAKGAALMAAFGLGTLPTLLAAGLLMQRAGGLFRARAFRVVSGALVFGFGISGLAQAFELGEQIRRGILCLG